MNTEHEVIEAALERADALAAGDPDRLRRLLHPAFHWTSHLGEQFDRDDYVRANTAGTITWKKQSLTDPEVAVVGQQVAVLRCMVADDVVTGEGGCSTFRMPMTQTWVKEEGRWLCLAGPGRGRRRGWRVAHACVPAGTRVQPWAFPVRGIREMSRIDSTGP
ncbi:nuclear transport factor 2 family protein [Nonomuraea helvata]|uniref:Nuclear transport factor 2 family protein n=1 Tax=Nonomuraea helvata TaxID=37484 RepID=A0ABV5S120_9ACTN